MQLFIIVLLISFVVFLFGLHILAKEDLIFVRKNVTIEALFNVAFYTAILGLLSARIVYVILHPSFGFLNPLVFFLFPYFPGLSLVGGIVGGIIFLLLYKRKKYPTSRIFDFFSMAFLGALPFGFFGHHLLSGLKDIFSGIFLPVIFFMTLLFFVKILVPLNLRGEIKDGSLGYLFLVVFSFTTLLAAFVRTTAGFSVFLQIDNILLLILFLTSLTLLILQEKETSFFRKDK